MRLGFDIDGVVANIANVMVDHINDKYGTNYTEDIFFHHDISKNRYVDDEELNKEIIQSVIDNVFHNRDMLMTVEPYPKAVESLITLKRMHSIHFITSRSLHIREVTIDWIRSLNIPFDSIHFMGPSADKKVKSSKGMMGRSLNLDFYVDDQNKHLEEMYRYKARWFKSPALFERPWNSWMPLDRGKFVVVKSWKEIIRHLGIHKR
jgi:uncharacterized HAD superfamily protein